jgi:peptidoglycan/LPS O-acetylase OafA/YrhL
MTATTDTTVVDRTALTGQIGGSTRLQALDALRALAILLVIGHHAAYRFSGSKDDVVAALLRSVGWIGVDIFFAISGFLIVRILIRDSAAGDLKGFFRRRAYRIVPIFALALLAFVVAALLTGRDADLLHRLWIPALFLNGWMIPLVGVEGVPYVLAWSLSVEEFAYLALAAFALCGHRGLWAGVLTFVLVALVVRWGVLASGTFAPESLYYFVPARLDAIGFGGLGALGAYGYAASGQFSRRWCGAATLLMIVCFQWSGGIGSTFLPAAGYAAFGFVCALWVTGLAEPGKHHQARLVLFLAPFGKVSYFIYLFHLFVLEGVRALSSASRVELRFWPAMVVSILICYLLARISWRHLEYPLITRSRSS